jgi:hypothetical protein
MKANFDFLKQADGLSAEEINSLADELVRRARLLRLAAKAKSAPPLNRLLWESSDGNRLN